MCTIKIVMQAVLVHVRTCVYSKHVTRLNLVKHGWEQGMEAAIVAHDIRKQEDGRHHDQNGPTTCESVRDRDVKGYSYTEFKCIIIDVCEDVTTDAHARMASYVYTSKQSI